MDIRAQSEAKESLSMTLLTGAIIIRRGKKKISAWRENDTSANDGNATTSLRSISDRDREDVKEDLKRTK